MKEIKTSITCEKCGKVQDVKSDVIKKDDFLCKDNNDKIYSVLYVACECGNNIVLQIDDEVSTKRKEKIFKLMRAAMRRREDNKAVGARAEKYAMNLNNGLDRYRDNLRKELEGKKMFNCMKNIEIIV